MNATTDLEELTFANLFSLSGVNSAKLGTGLEESGFEKIKETAKTISEPLDWGALRAAIGGMMNKALDTKVLDGFVFAWQKGKDLLEKAEESRKSPKTAVPWNLLEHTIDSTLHPYVNIMLGPNVIQRVDFEVTLSTELDAVQLNLLDGSIVSIQPGRCEWSGSIAIPGAQLLEQKLAALELRGHIELKRPIPIAKKDGQANLST